MVNWNFKGGRLKGWKTDSGLGDIGTINESLDLVERRINHLENNHDVEVKLVCNQGIVTATVMDDG